MRDAPRHHRLVRLPHDGPLDLWELRARTRDGEWERQYAFTREPFEAPDYEVINWHIATNPRSPFSRMLYVQRTTGSAHLALAGRTLVVTPHDRGAARKRELADTAEVARVLAEDFALRLPEGARLPG